jgi:hypothetical protein
VGLSIATGARGALIRNTRGAVMVEFLIAFPPVLLLFLCTVQLSLLLAMELAVEHSAVVGSRSAMVVFDDDPEHHDGEPRRAVSGAAPAWRLQDPDSRGAAPPLPTSRAETVRRAVAVVLAPFAPPWRIDGGAVAPAGLNLMNAVSGWRSRLAFGLSEYPRFALAVTFPVAPGSSVLQAQRLDGDAVTVRVTYLAPCLVPVASALICRAATRRVASALERRRWTSPSDYGSATADVTLRSELGALPEPALLRDALERGARFAVTRAEATLPLQGGAHDGGGT